MKNFIELGKKMPFTAAAAITSGDLVLVGIVVGIAESTYAQADTNCILNLSGVFEVPKEADVIAQGDKLYFNAANKTVTTTSSTNKVVGFAWTAAGSGDATVQVRLAYTV